MTLYKLYTSENSVQNVIFTAYNTRILGHI